MLKTRIMTAIVLTLGLLFALFNTSDTVWTSLTLAITLLGVWEWANLIKLNKVQMLSYVALAFAVGILIISISQTPFAAYEQHTHFVWLASATFFWVLLAPIWLLLRKKLESKLLMAMLGLLLLVATWLGMVGLHDISPWVLLSIIATVSLADSAAYFSGKRFGRHKLAPEISPGKTWEGVAGALLAVTFYSATLCYYQGFSYWLVVGFWLVVVFSVMGDLFESMLKRQAGIKDSSQLLPGHGGILDRIDGFIPVLAIVLFCTYTPLFIKLQAHG